MPEIRIPILISGADALREMDAVAKSATNSLRSVESAAGSVKTGTSASAQAIAEMTAALKANTAALQSIVPAANSAGNAIRNVGNSVGGMRMVNAEIRAMEGNFLNNNRAAAAFMVRMAGMGSIAQAAFPVFGALAFAGVLETIGTKFYQVVRQAQDAPAKITSAFHELQSSSQSANDELRKTNDHLANEIAKLEHKPQNLLAEALDDARINADKLAESLDKDVATMAKLVKENSVGWFGRLLTGQQGTGDIEDFINKYQSQIADINYKGNAAVHSATTREAADKAQKDWDAALAGARKTAQDQAQTWIRQAQTPQTSARLWTGATWVDAPVKDDPQLRASRLAMARGFSTQLYAEGDLATLQTQHSQLEGQLPVAQAARGAQDRAEEEIRRRREFLRGLDRYRNEQYKKRLDEAARFGEEENKSFEKDQTGRRNRQFSDLRDTLSFILPAPTGPNGYESPEQMKARMDYQTRMIGINGQPGNEADTALQQANSRLATIKAVYDREIAILDVNRDAEKIAELKSKADLDSAQVRYEYEEKIAEIRKRQQEEAQQEAQQAIDQTRRTAGDMFDAMTARGGGNLSRYFRDQLHSVERTVFENAATPVLTNIRSLIQPSLNSIQTGPDGKPNILGNLLQRTPFGTQDLQTIANERLLLNNNLTDINNKELARLNSNLEGKTTAPGGSSSAAGGFSSAFATFAELVSGGGSAAAAAKAASYLASSAKSTSLAGWTPTANDIATEMMSYKAHVTLGDGDQYIRGAAQGGVPFNPATGSPWAADPRLNDAVRQAIAIGSLPITDATRGAGTTAHTPISLSWFSKDLQTTNAWLTKNANLISAAGTAAGTGFGAYEGFREGGTRGALAGSAALVGGVTSLLGNPAIQKAIGTVASSVPIVGGVISAGLGLFSSLIGQSVQQRESQIQNIIGGSFDRLPQAKHQEYDITGYQSDLTGSNSARPIINQTISIPITAFNSKSIEDNWPSIANAVKMAADMNHPVVDAMRQARMS